MFRLDVVEEKLRQKAPDPGTSTDGPRAAVAAIFREATSGGGAELFFIVRAERPSDPWSGHIAFPGGRREPSDASLLMTAIRETREEVGIELQESELVARLPDVPAYTRSRAGNLVVTSFVFAVRRPVVVEPNVEVADTMWISLARLAAGEGRETFSFTWDGKDYALPSIRFEPNKPVLWGLTHRMLEAILEALGHPMAVPTP